MTVDCWIRRVSGTARARRPVALRLVCWYFTLRQARRAEVTHVAA